MIVKKIMGYSLMLFGMVLFLFGAYLGLGLTWAGQHTGWKIIVFIGLMLIGFVTAADGYIVITSDVRGNDAQ